MPSARDIFFEAHSKLMPDGRREVTNKKDKEILVSVLITFVYFFSHLFI